ncbi:hypothetical protein FB566_1722 [Stackebrandtia endophytica]|uniref:Uncharacterized protein n=1 Tax=Stackebrandtia endophytica TaxID=1496996 RepID=A0A543AUF3_9ACTN|nr:hypothetical protein [Stackebrandtia endophytica]TQL76200.1 hypothetical protein FB566_1722 [Stackebrandtia endophytica]
MLLVSGLVTAGAIIALNTTKPAVGDCLASTRITISGGMEMVDCSDPSAKYEVVAYTTSYAGQSLCHGFPEGERHHYSNRGDLRWEICVVPL